MVIVVSILTLLEKVFFDFSVIMGFTWPVLLFRPRPLPCLLSTVAGVLPLALSARRSLM